MEPRHTDDESLPELVADLLHGIICMANNPEDTTGLLIIGIDEEGDF